MAMKLVEINNIHKRFGNTIILNGVTLHVDQGENLVIFGKSGTGKSVLLKCLVGLLEPDQGEIFFEGKNVLHFTPRELKKFRLEVSFLFQSAALYDSMSVRENLEFPLKRNFKFSQDVIDQKVKRALEMVSLEKAIDKMPSELSGGMRKRIGLARSIITEPKLMLYDEPTTGLDPITTKGISKLIRDLQSELKTTSITITHDLICAEIIADRAIVIRDGLLIFEGQLRDAIQSNDSFLRNFFSPEIFTEE